MTKKNEKPSAPAKRGEETRVLSADRSVLVFKKARFTVVSGRDSGREMVLRKPLVTIGTLPGNDLAVTDATVSRSHAVVEETSSGYIIRDLDSTNGTLLDGVRIREGYLAPGSRIRIGETEISFTPLEERVEVPRSDAERFGGLIGRSPAMQEIYGILERVSPTEVTVLIEGETGTGKELAARAVHENSSRRGGPFVVLDCGAVARNLIESELFGHEKGAFTDAARSRSGVFELAHGGTIFLDEIGELPLDLQPKLLRALDQREAKRIGSDKPVAFDVRVIAATNRDLEQEVRAGRFREDLFYRLSVVRIAMPPLLKRKQDIPTIASHLLAGISGEIGRKISGLSEDAAAALTAYSWPGNVRELRNVLGRASALCSGDRIEARDLFLAQKKKGGTLDGLSGRTLEEIEKAAIHATLQSVNGNRTEAAKLLGIAYSTLYEKMKKYGMRE